MDDEEYFLDLARRFLEKEGDIRATGAESAEAALECLKGNRYDAIISDYQMPGMDGIALLKRLRERGDTTPFIILTGRGREQVAIEALNRGADFYLQKGTDPKLHFIELKNILLQAVTRHRTVEALVESERKYRQLVELAREGIWAIDADTVTTYVNPRMEEMLGYAPGGMAGRHLFEFMDAEGREKAAAFLERRKQGIKEQHEFEFMHKDGRLVATRLETSPILDESGNYCGALAVIADITEEKRAEAALRKSEEWYRNLAEASQDIIYIIDRDDRVAYLNARALELLGRRKEEVVGRPRALLFPPDRNESMKGNLGRVFSNGEPCRVESPVPFGERISWQDTTLVPLRSPEGTITCVMGISRDITGRKQIEEALRESEEKYRSLVERAHEGIIVVQDNIVKFCNRRAALMWGGDCREIVGRPYQDFIDPADASRIRENYERRMAGEEVPRQYDTLLVRKDGSRFHGELNAGTFLFEGRSADLILFRDISERKMAEDALMMANRKLNLLSSVTRHDILNQIMVITGYLELARTSSSLGEMKQMTDLAGKAAVTMRRQLEFAREYQDIGVHSPVWQDLREVIARAVPGSGTGVKIQLDINLVKIYADPLLERVFSNLIENALIHGEKVTTIRFSARVTDGALSILCGDDGIGIPAREKKKIFAQGYGRNTGFGLFLVREILGITGATIREIGQEGKGASFEITIPKDAYRIGG